MTLVCIIPGPTKELRREDIGERWCFGCRKRLPHVAILLADELADEMPSYYGPVWVRRCSRCNRDRTTFGS